MSQAERVVLLRQGARLPELDGIRGLAILPVLFLHWIVQPIEPLLRDLSPHLWALAKLAWCGVDLFFVLSGFLIAGILLDHSEAPNLFRAFYARRAARILPAYLLLLLIVSLPLGQQPPHIRSGEVPLSAYLIFLRTSGRPPEHARPWRSPPAGRWPSRSSSTSACRSCSSGSCARASLRSRW